MLKQQSNFLIILLLVFFFIFSSYAVLPFMKKKTLKIKGEVKKGTGQTSLYGYPTANMEINKNLDSGIYSGKCKYGNVTVYTDGPFNVKCHIHNFNKNIIGEQLNIRKVKFLEPHGNPDDEH